jgi:ankyrin repeat protein
MRTLNRWTAVVLAGFALLIAAAAACHPRATTPLTIAAARGDVDTIERLIAAGADPNSGGGGAFTPLIWAARNGRIEAVKRLVALGANVDLRQGVNDWTPMMHALHKGQTAAAIALLDLGADISGRRGQRTLAMGVGYGNAQMTQLLLARGVDPHVNLGGGPSLLALAAAGAYDIDYQWSGCRQHTATVRALIERAPDLELNDTFWDNNALRFVRRRGCTEMLSMLEMRSAAARVAAR